VLETQLAQLVVALPHPNGGDFPGQLTIPVKQNMKAVITRSGKTMAESKAKSKKISPTDPVEEEEKVEAEVEVEPRSEKEEENLEKTSPKDISDTHMLSYNAAILDNFPDNMDDPGVPIISCLIDTQKFDQAL
jgi:hypothetical protein